MVRVIHSENLVILYTNHFLFFEWTLQESDLRIGSQLQSPEFITIKGEKPSFLEFRTTIGYQYLFLWNPKFVENGRYVLTISDKTNSPLDTLIKSTGSTINSEFIELLPYRRLPSSKEYPLILTCTINASKLNDETDQLKSSATMVKTSVLKNKVCDPQNEIIRKLILDFKVILDEAINTDIVLKMDGGIIKAHKVVLQARSPVFRKMFDGDSKETAENEVVITDIGSATMKRLVSFLYAATNETGNFEETMELYYAADKYEVLSLREACKIELANKLDANNACSLFTLANRHNEEDLKEKVVQFVSANFKSAVNRDSLNSMNKDDIVLLMSLCVPNIN